MSKKVEIEFPVSFDTDQLGVHHLGRLYIGPLGAPSTVRIVLGADGAVKLALSKAALKYVVAYEEYSEDTLFGFGGTGQ